MADGRIWGHSLVGKILISSVTILFGVLFLSFDPSAGTTIIEWNGPYAFCVGVGLVIASIVYIRKKDYYKLRIGDIVAAVFFIAIYFYVFIQFGIKDAESMTGGQDEDVLRTYTYALCVLMSVDAALDGVQAFALRDYIGKRWLSRAFSALVTVAINVFLMRLPFDDIVLFALLMGIGLAFGGVWDLLNGIIANIRLRKYF